MRFLQEPEKIRSTGEWAFINQVLRSCPGELAGMPLSIVRAESKERPRVEEPNVTRNQNSEVR